LGNGVGLGRTVDQRNVVGNTRHGQRKKERFARIRNRKNGGTGAEEGREDRRVRNVKIVHGLLLEVDGRCRHGFANASGIDGLIGSQVGGNKLRVDQSSDCVGVEGRHGDGEQEGFC